MSSIHHFTGTDTDFNWGKVLSMEYTSASSRGASGKIIIGEEDNAEYFVFRYFRIEPGGHSTLNDYHAHDHGVFVLHGQAVVTIESVDYEVGPRDIVYISPLEHHHLTVVGNEPLGFLCVIPNKMMLEKLQSRA